MAESYSVKAILSAVDKGFKSTLGRCSDVLTGIDNKISGFSFGVLTGAGQAAFNAVANSASDLIGEISDSNAAWKTFAGNMEIVEKSGQKLEKSTAEVKKELQDFAQDTVYSSSDMASTYAQLVAVGTKGTTKLVKGFGGLAAAAENPQQAMKTLSQQATQMAAKPTIAWADFKLMLEQTPAGIAAVAKYMKMTTAEMVIAVQEGKIATEDFFDAIGEVGTNPEFTKLATEAKTIDQAMDGLQETVGNKLTPAFEVFNKKAIKAVDAVAEKIAETDAEDLAEKVATGFDKASKYVEAFETSFDGVGTEIGEAVSAVKESLSELNGEFGSTESVGEFKSAMDVVAGGIKTVANLATEHSDKIAWLISNLPKIVIALKGFSVAKKVVPFVNTFAGGIASLASKGLGGIASKLFGISEAQEATGKSSKSSAKKMLMSAKTYALTGVAVLTIAAGFALLAYSAIQLANAGPLAIGVMAGLVVAVGGLSVGMMAMMNTISATPKKLATMGTTMLSLGAAVLMVSTGFLLLSYAATNLASGGGLAIGVMVGMVGAIALLAVGAAAVAPALTAGAAGMIAFGAAVVLVGSGALLAAASISVVAGVLPTISAYGLQGASAIAALGGSLIIFAAGATVAGGACVILGAGLVVVGAGMVVLTAGMAAGAIGTLAFAAALTTVTSQMKDISINASKAENALSSMQSSVNVVESGLAAMGSKAKTAMNAVKDVFDNTAKESKRSGKEVGTGFARGVESEIGKATTAASKMIDCTTSMLRFGENDAYSSGTYISKGFAQGMLSCLGEIQSAATKMVAAADAAIVAKAKIHSPSKMSEGEGEYFGEGWVRGILSKVRDARDAAEQLISMPTVRSPRLAGHFDMELSEDYEYYRNAQYTIVVPVELDGRETARVIAPYTEEELNKRQTRDSRKRGKV